MQLTRGFGARRLLSPLGLVDGCLEAHKTVKKLSHSRLFIAIVPPDSIQDALAELEVGLPGAHWTPPPQIHLTLRFLGDVAPRTTSDIRNALESLRIPTFHLEVCAVGHFPPRGRPRVLWAGVSASAALAHLQQRVDKAMVRIGLPPEPRKWQPHLTLAKLQGAPEIKVAEFLATNALLRLQPFAVTQFHLFSSVTSPEGADYTLEESFDLVEN